MSEGSREDTVKRGKAQMSRRKALAKLGIGAAIAYAAPTVLHLDRSANAAECPSGTVKCKGGCIPIGDECV